MSTPRVRVLMQFALTASCCRWRVSESHLEIATIVQMTSATTPQMIMTGLCPNLDTIPLCAVSVRPVAVESLICRFLKGLIQYRTSRPCSPKEDLVSVFESAYRELKLRFKEEVKRDNEVDSANSLFLPNVVPLAPVDFILVGSEPSRARWAPTDEKGRENIAKGFRNFRGCRRCEPLHYCVDRWLCQGSGSYYLTDLAKGAVFGSVPWPENWEKYERWYPLLLAELELVAKPDAMVISIGSSAGGFLVQRGLRGHVGRVPHYSARSRALGNMASAYPTEWKSFREEIFELPSGKPVSDATKKWMFYYRVLFERFRPGGCADWGPSPVAITQPAEGPFRPPCWSCGLS